MIRDYFDLFVNRGLHPDEATALARSAGTSLYFRNSSCDKFRVHPDGKWQYTTAGGTRAADFTWVGHTGETTLYFSEESAKTFRALDKEHVKKLKESAAEWATLVEAAGEMFGAPKPDDFSSLKKLFGKMEKAGKEEEPQKDPPLATFTRAATLGLGKAALSRCVYHAYGEKDSYASWLCGLLVGSKSSGDLANIWHAAGRHPHEGAFYSTPRPGGFELSYRTGRCTVTVLFGLFLPGQVDDLCSVTASAPAGVGHPLYSEVLKTVLC